LVERIVYTDDVGGSSPSSPTTSGPPWGQRLMLKLAFPAVLALCLTYPANAEIVAQTASGFTITHQSDVSVSPDAAYDAFVSIESWWDESHSYGGKATALKLDPRAGGFWLETLEGGGFVIHMTVLQAVPGSRLVLSGGLGPLARMGVNGTMTVVFSKSEKGTLVKLDYAVGGFDPDGFKQLAPAVDSVLAHQFQRFSARAMR
jgi:uncharacterized protein YndB with AHSA1/START domain